MDKLNGRSFEFRRKQSDVHGVAWKHDDGLELCAVKPGYDLQQNQVGAVKVVSAMNKEYRGWGRSTRLNVHLNLASTQPASGKQLWMNLSMPGAAEVADGRLPVKAEFLDARLAPVPVEFPCCFELLAAVHILFQNALHSVTEKP